MKKSTEFSDQRRSKRKSPPEPKPAPWLVFTHGKDGKFQTFYSICDDSTAANKFIPELNRKSFWQKSSHQGWCIIVCDEEDDNQRPAMKNFSYGDCFLWNPVSMETIQLPSLLNWFSLGDEFYTKDCVLSSPPLNGDSIVYFLFGVRKEIGKDILVYCRPGDKEWRTHKLSGAYSDVGLLLSMLYFKGKLYIMARGDEHLEIDVQHGSSEHGVNNKIILSISKIHVTECIEYDFVGGICDGKTETYFMESIDEIFKIYRVFITRGVYECVTNMNVYKLDFSSMSWVEVKRLDHHVLFVSYCNGLSCLPSELGLKRGCVYFTQLDEMSFYKYDLEDKSVMLSVPCPDLPKPWFSPNWLMIPNTQREEDCDGRGGTESMSGNNNVGGYCAKEMEKLSLAISPIRTRTSINDGDEKEVMEEARPWDKLNEDIVWFISSYLSPLDYIHLRAVCRNYRLAYPLKEWRRFCCTMSLETTALSPWLACAKDNESAYSFINPMHNDENYLMGIPELLKGSTIRFSKGGWLLMSKGYYSLFFYNPFTKAIIKLPDLPDGRNYLFRGISFSSLPTSSDCVVFAISNYMVENSVCISFIKRRDTMWTSDILTNVFLPPNRTNMDFEPSLNSPIFYNGAFYCLDMNGTLGVFTSENGTRWEVLSMVQPPNCGFIYKSYLVELEGKLLSVLLGHYGKWVRIFRLNMSERIWAEVEHLGRHVLFISNTSCIARIAPTRRMENKIYFPRLQNKGILFYSLDSGKYHSLESEHYGTDYCNSKGNVRCSWIEPNWSVTTQPNLDWS